MSKKGPSAPDPYATSAAQTQSNQQTASYNAALNRVDQYTPYGSSVYTVTGSDPSGAPTYRQDVTLTPMAQQELENEQRQDAALSNLGFGLADQAKASLANPVNGDGLPALTGGPQAGAGMFQTFSGEGPQASNYHLDTGRPNTTGYDQGGPIQNRIAAAPGLQQSLDYSKLSPLSTDFAGTSKAASDAVYNQAASRLDPQWGNAQHDLEAKLANQGIVQGSEAWQRAQDEFGRNRNDAYNQANFSAVNAGLAAQQQGYNQALSTRQQGQNEVDTAGQFANAAQAQQFGQNQAQGQFANQAQAQANSQNAAQAQFQNAAQQQDYAQQMGNTQLYNQAQQQNMDTWLAVHGFNNNAAQQTFQNQQSAAAAANAARAQGLQERSSLAMMPLNQLNALRSGTQITNPSFTSVPQSTMANTDVAGNIYKSAQINAANSNNFMNGLFSMGAAALSNPAVFASDRRLKRNILRIGTTPVLKAPLYAFRYLWDEVIRIGVMAQDMLEIRPDAVVTMPGGYLAVDYGKVA